MALGDAVQAVAVHRQAGEVHRQEGAGAGGDGRLDVVEIEIARRRIHIHEDRRGTGAHDDVGGG
ncbi:MAG: hypothetical protein H6R12_1890, partial [Proteobacteria bacterium]|nr:hypothetical protein [Pseudomonadota bacterium]